MRGPDLGGQVLDKRYEIGERIAEGAMGVVYRATRLKLDRAVAIKVMHAALPDADGARKRFEREAQLMARLEHPHCVSIIDYGVHRGKPYVVMQLVRGRDLYDVLAEQRCMEPQRAVDVMSQVLSGLAHAHEQGIVHRDIKPANIMITPKAPLGVHARILDFGLARMLGSTTSTSEGVAVGTPSYMSPEQCRGDDLDARADVYACGVLLFEMLTGRKPFVADDPIAIIKQHLERPPPRLADVAPADYGALEDVVARALAKDRGDRYASAVQMAEALAAAVSSRGAPDATARLGAAATRRLPAAGEASSEVRARSPRSGARWWLVAVLALVAAGAFAWPQIRRELAGDEPAAAPAGIPDAVAIAGTDAAAGAARDAAVVVAPPDAAVAGDAAVVAVVADALAGGADATVAAAPADAGIAVAVAVAPVDAAVVADARPATAADAIVARATRLAAGGDVAAALEQLRYARRLYPDSAQLPLLAGKLMLRKLYVTDGLPAVRAALALDPTVARDPELAAAAVKAFTTLTAYHGGLARLLRDLGDAAVPPLEAAAKSHPNPTIRARAAQLLRAM